MHRTVLRRGYVAASAREPAQGSACGSDYAPYLASTAFALLLAALELWRHPRQLQGEGGAGGESGGPGPAPPSWLLLAAVANAGAALIYFGVGGALNHAYYLQVPPPARQRGATTQCPSWCCSVSDTACLRAAPVGGRGVEVPAHEVAQLRRGAPRAPGANGLLTPITTHLNYESGQLSYVYGEELHELRVPLWGGLRGTPLARAVQPAKGRAARSSPLPAVRWAPSTSPSARAPRPGDARLIFSRLCGGRTVVLKA